MFLWGLEDGRDEDDEDEDEVSWRVAVLKMLKEIEWIRKLR